MSKEIAVIDVKNSANFAHDYSAPIAETVCSTLAFSGAPT
jgi:hypothetical protein